MICEREAPSLFAGRGLLCSFTSCCSRGPREVREHSELGGAFCCSFRFHLRQQLFDSVFFLQRGQPVFHVVGC
jgi:hypothetical protein